MAELGRAMLSVVRLGMARHGQVGPGKARFGEGGWQPPWFEATAPTQGAVRLGEARYGKAGPGTAGLGEGNGLGGWQPSVFEALTPAWGLAGQR